MTEKAAQSIIISSNIKRLRGEKGWNQSRLADEAKITAAALSKIESGSGRVPTIVVLQKIASALDVTVNEITGEVSKLINPADQKFTTFYRRWGMVEELPEEDQQRLLDIAERLKEISKK